MVYSVSVIYDFNSGLPGVLALGIIGIYAAYDSSLMLKDYILEDLSEMDLAKEDGK